MARPSGSIGLIKGHRTKKEIEQRTNAEKALMSGRTITESKTVKNDPVAHAEFLRVNKLLAAVGKNDALIGAVINRYCLLASECANFEKKREVFSENLDELIETCDIDSGLKYKLEAQMQASILSVDKQIQAKRKMLLDIEKENCMTVAAALRAIPKVTQTKANPLLEALSDGDD